MRNEDCHQLRCEADHCDPRGRQRLPGVRGSLAGSRRRRRSSEVLSGQEPLLCVASRDEAHAPPHTLRWSSSTSWLLSPLLSPSRCDNRAKRSRRKDSNRLNRDRSGAAVCSLNSSNCGTDRGLNVVVRSMRRHPAGEMPCAPILFDGSPRSPAATVESGAWLCPSQTPSASLLGQGLGRLAFLLATSFCVLPR